MKKYVIDGVADQSPCPLCIEPTDGRSKEKRPPVFVVGCDGGYSGPVCAPHLAALIRAAEPPVAPAKPVNMPVKPTIPAMTPALPGIPVTASAIPVGNGAK